MRRRTILLPILALWLAAPDTAAARGPIGAILGAPHALIHGLFGHQGHRRHHARHRDGTGSRMARASVPEAGVQEPVRPAAVESVTGIHAGGSVFWPDAAADILNDTLWPNGASSRFWDHGYADLIAAILGGAGGRDATRTSRTGADQAIRCGPAGEGAWSIDPLRQTVQPADSQQPAVDQLRVAADWAVERMRAACPAEAPRTPTERLHAMLQRLRAMDQVVSELRVPVETFHAALSGEQKARLDGGTEQPNRGCRADIQGTTGLLMRTLERAVQPTERQRIAFGTLAGTVAKMGEMLRSCPATRPSTPMARLDADRERIGTMLFATQIVHTALNRLYYSLTDDQKARFDAVGEPRAQAAR